MSWTFRRSDAPAVPVEHVDIDEMRPRIDLTVVECAAAADDAAAAGGGDVEPHLVGVGGALRQGVADFERAHHGFEKICEPGRSAGTAGTQRCSSSPSMAPPFFTPKMSTRATPAQEGLLGLQRIRIIAHERQGGVRRWKQMVVDAQLVGASKIRAPKSPDDRSGMWQPAQLRCATGG